MYLAIDLGDKKCGIAIEIEGIIIPKDIVLRPKLINYLKKIVKKYNITDIIVGLPYDLYGKKLKQLEKTKKFINNLERNFPKISIKGIDERFSSFEAINIGKTLGFSNEKNIDDLSAALILETFIKKNR